VAIAAMVVALPASAETIDRSTLPPAGATATPTVVEQPPAEPQASATPAAGSTAPEPVDTRESPIVSPPPQPPVESGPDAATDSVVSSARSSVGDAPVPTASSADAVARTTAIADSATSAVKKVDVPAAVDADAAAIPVFKREASKLTEAVGRNLDEAIAPTLDRLRVTGAAALDRADLLDLQPGDLLDAVASASPILTGLPAGQAPQASGGSQPDQATGFLPEPPRTNLLSQPGAAVPGPGGLAPQAGGYQALPSPAETAGVQTSSSGSRGSVSVAQPVGVSFAGGTAAHRAGSPAPADVPPAPGSPASAVSDAGGPSFVPIVALLALLALAVPAALRRLGRAEDFHPPIPFLCALERPG
jgi:hypothetical protein